MSSILSAPPARIPIGGAGGGPGGPGGLGAALGGLGGPPAPSDTPDATGPDDPDAGSVTSLLKRAMTLVQQAGQLEKDDVDAAQITKIAADIHKAIANEQATKDAAMGAGPATKMIRKAAPSGGGY